MEKHHTVQRMRALASSGNPGGGFLPSSFLLPHYLRAAGRLLTLSSLSLFLS